MNYLNESFENRLKNLEGVHHDLVTSENIAEDTWNGIYRRFNNPVLTRAHAPLHWRFDLSKDRNPLLLERLGVNAVFNPGAIFHDGKFILVTRFEGNDRKSTFALAESESGIDGFSFKRGPLIIPETDDPDTNIYDMRLTRHEDGNIYGVFCTERRDPSAPAHDTSSSIAQAGIVRTHDLINWERLPDLKTNSPQQRNVVLHPEFVEGKYAWYTRPQDDFIEAGKGGGIGWALSEDIDGAVIDEETIIDERVYHTIKEAKNGQGPAPIRTEDGWLHLVHGVRPTAAGLRYVLYMFMTSLNEPWKIIHAPGGHLIAPQEGERIGDVSNVVFSNGWIEHQGTIYIYYASSDTRIHVAVSSIDRLVDYCKFTPVDGLTAHGSAELRRALIENNKPFVKNR